MTGHLGRRRRARTPINVVPVTDTAGGRLSAFALLLTSCPSLVDDMAKEDHCENS
jgi:hypothetical protein